MLNDRKKRKRRKEQGRLLVNGFDLGPAQRDPDTGVIEQGPHVPEPRHCDEYIEDPSQPEALRKWLDRARQPAHGMTNPAPWPECYADCDGKTVRLTMASRLGTVGWTSNLTQEFGYEHRGWLEHLTNFRDKP